MGVKLLIDADTCLQYNLTVSQEDFQEAQRGITQVNLHRGTSCLLIILNDKH